MSSRSFLSCLLACLACLASCATLSDDEQKPRPLHNAKPVYPQVAALHGRGGKVELDCTITEKGDATDCLATRGDHDFKAAALSYMRVARYAPALRDGVPVAFTHYTLGINFIAPAPQPIAIPAECDVSAAGRVRNCRAQMARPPATWPIIKSIAEAETLAPDQAGGNAVGDRPRALSLSFALVSLPWFGPVPQIEGGHVLVEQLACDRRQVRPNAVSVACTPEAQTDTLPDWDAHEHVRAWLGIETDAPAVTGDFSDPS